MADDVAARENFVSLEGDIIDRLNKAHDVVNDIIWGRVKPRMCIPANPKSDTDLTIGQLFRDAIAALQAMTAERDAARLMVRGYSKLNAALEVNADQTLRDALDTTMRDWLVAQDALDALTAERDAMKAELTGEQERVDEYQVALRNAGEQFSAAEDNGFDLIAGKPAAYPVDGLKTFVIQAQSPCDYLCEWVEPYGFVPECGCPVHDNG